MEWQRYGAAYRAARYGPDPGRDAVWRAVVEDLDRSGYAVRWTAGTAS